MAQVTGGLGVTPSGVHRRPNRTVLSILSSAISANSTSLCAHAECIFLGDFRFIFTLIPSMMDINGMREVLMSIAAWGRSTFVVAIFVSFSACSVADYEKPISDFADATTAAAEALDSLDQQITTLHIAALNAQVVANKKIIKFDDGDCESDSTNCRLVATDVISNESEPLTPKDTIGRLTALLRSIQAYAQNLTAVVRADTAAKVEMHTNSALGSINNLSATVEKFGGNKGVAVSDYTTSFGKLVNWAVGQYVAKVKLDALGQATKQAQPVIERASEIFEAAAKLISVPHRIKLSNAVDNSFQAFDTAHDESSLNDLIVKAKAYDSFLQAKPSAVFVKLREAHGALAAKLQDDDLSLSNVAGKIGAYVAEAKTLMKIVRELRDAGKK